MAVTFRADAEVINGTAGTSVVVSKPAGTANDDVLIAFISETGTGSITPPAGWVLIGSVASGTDVTEAAYYKIASSEGASWTWTLGASVRNWGWVGAYIGVNTGDPIAFSVSNNVFLNSSNVTPITGRFSSITGWWGVAGASAVRTASGSPTTWGSHSILSERFDNSTNGGAGTDIAGVVGDFEEDSELIRFSLGVATASQIQTACATWLVLLRPEMTAYDGGLIEPIAEIEIDGVWTDVSEFVDNSQGATIQIGRSNATSVASPTRITLTLFNDDGRFTDDNPTGTYYPHFGPGVRLRVSVPYGYNPPTELATAFIDSIEPGWDLSTRLAIVSITASGRLRRLQRGEDPLLPPLQRTIAGSGTLGVPPVAYWTFQDGSRATQAASQVGGLPVIVTGVSFASDSDMAGSAPLATLSTLATMSGIVAPHTNAGSWIFGIFYNIPTGVTLVGDTVLFELATTGATAVRWRVELLPGSPDTLRATAFNSAGASIGSTSTSFDEAEVYGQWTLFHLSAVTNGADVDFSVGLLNDDAGNGSSSTLASHTHGTVATWSNFVGSFLDNAGVGHAFVICNADFDVTFQYLDFGPAMGGHDQDTPLSRVTRVASEVGEPLTSFTALGESQIFMGPQPISTFVAASREAEEVGRALLHDGGPGGDLVWLMRSTRYNAITRMTLDMAQGQLAAPFRPVRDDQSLRNDWTISRQNGSSAHAINAASIASKGRYKDSATLNLYEDTHLQQLADWRVAEGTATAKRYPAICGNLRRSPELVEDWLNCRIWARINATNLMSQHPDVIDADVFIEGITQQISTDVWRFGINSSPASVFEVGVLDDDVLGKLDSASSTLAGDVTDSATSLLVATVNETDLWTTDSGEMPIPIVIGGEDMTVSAIASSVRDTFTRTVAASSWGTSDSGHTYQLNSTGFSVNGTQGVIALSALNDERHATATLGVASLQDLRVWNTLGVTPTGAAINWGILLRYTDTANYYWADVQVQTTSALTLRLIKRVAGVATVITTVTAPITHSTTVPRVLRASYDPASGLFRSRVWSSDASEPTEWHLSTTDTAVSAGTRAGVVARLMTGNTNAGPVSFLYDNLALINPQTFTVTRSVNGVVKAHSAGAGSVSEVHVKNAIKLAL